MDLFTYQRSVLEQFPAGSRTAPRLLVLWEETIRAWDAVRSKVSLWGWVDVPGHVREDWQRQADAFEDRMVTYRRTLEATPAGAGDVNLPGFLVNYQGSGHTTADFLTPITLANQLEAIGQAMDGAWLGFLGELKAGLAKIATAPVDAANQANAAASSIALWLKVAAGVAVGGTLLWLILRARE